MHDAAAIAAPATERTTRPLTIVRASIPTLAESLLASGSALILVLSFPDFDLWWLAWIGLVPLIVAVLNADKASKAFLLGWLWGTIFFYGTCWWLTYPMIHYAQLPRSGHIQPWLAYLLLLLPVLLVALFPASFCLLLSRVIAHFGFAATLLTPLIWVSLEWARYAVTGLVWNAIGYSQAFHPALIQTARGGGVYAVSFVLLGVNSAVALLFLRKFRAAVVGLVATAVIVAIFSYGSHPLLRTKPMEGPSDTLIVAIQPDVPMEITDEQQQMNELLERHLALSTSGLSTQRDKSVESLNSLPRLVIWPESPMNFSYSRDPHLRAVVTDFVRKNQTALLLNSLEHSPTGGDYNSAILINEKGEKVAQYDKIRLMPFGEYVPLPRWLPGASSVRAIVGEFTPGSSYTLMPLGAWRAGVFICVEAAHPSIARAFTNEGANVLINISNDGYLGPTPVMRQHLANAIFRAVENNRPLVRVTNAGISAYISSNGSVWDETPGFQPAVRIWTISKDAAGITFYSRHGDIFVYGCALICLGIISATFMSRRFVSAARR